MSEQIPDDRREELVGEGDHTLPDAAATLERPPDAQPELRDLKAEVRLRSGDQVGPYRLQQKLGEGGMGEVWQAQQVSPVRREVALKLIKWGMDTRAVIARFESERQALAVMDHPNIARVLDAGATELGRPYFVMELVQGEAITTYCDRHRLSTKERLELFAAVCDGVQHAHHKAIIHRDLKPSNVLVTVKDDRAVPKIIDFGVAKATAQSLTEHTVFTQLGQWIGTPAYMSPEQAEMSGLDIDTRSDVYSLGVLLYELLVGALPIDPEELRGAALEEVRHRIRDSEPARPSTRVETKTAEHEELARLRSTVPHTLVRRLRGDLDWITLKALEKDRTRRYASAHDLAADIGRALRDEPVLAGPPSPLYRGRKFVRRHRFGVAFATTVAILLLALAVGMGVQARRIAAERDLATREAQRAQAVSEFLVELFENVDPSNSRGEQISAREVLDTGARRLGSELTSQPRTRAALMQTIGRVYTALGLFADAEPLLNEARATLESADSSALERASALQHSASLYSRMGKEVEGEAMVRQAIALRLEAGDDASSELASCYHTLGSLLVNQGELEAAGDAHRTALKMFRANEGEDSAKVASSLHNLGNVAFLSGNSKEAAGFYRRAIAIEERAGESYNLATSLHTLALTEHDLGRPEEALSLEERSLAMRERILGTEHWHVALSLTTIGNLLRDLGRGGEAVAPLQRALRIGRASLGEQHGEVAWMRNSLARNYVELERWEEAEELLHMGLGAHRDAPPAGAADEADPATLNTLAQLYLDTGRAAAAEQAFRRALRIDEAELGAEHSFLIASLEGIAASLVVQQRLEEAVVIYRRALALVDRHYDADHPERAELVASLNAALRALGRSDEMVALPDAAQPE